MDQKVGMLAQENLSLEEISVFLDLLRATKKTTAYDILYYILAEEFLIVLDSLEGESLRVPSRDETLKLIDYAKIHTFLNAHRENPHAIKDAADRFQRRTQSITRIEKKVQELLEEADLSDNET
jgi:hypothetical protein